MRFCFSCSLDDANSIRLYATLRYKHITHRHYCITTSGDRHQATICQSTATLPPPNADELVAQNRTRISLRNPYGNLSMCSDFVFCFSRLFSQTCRASADIEIPGFNLFMTTCLRTKSFTYNKEITAHPLSLIDVYYTKSANLGMRHLVAYH